MILPLAHLTLAELALLVVAIAAGIAVGVLLVAHRRQHE